MYMASFPRGTTPCPLIESLLNLSAREEEPA